MTRVIVSLGFLLTFAAGLVVGMRAGPVRSADPADPAPPTAADRPTTRPGWLTSELQLTTEQQQQMRAIWSEAARHGGRDQDEKRRQLRRERDAAIAALVGEDHKASYDAIVKAYADGMAQLEAEWRARFQRAVEQTRAILTPEQQAKYELILSRHAQDGGRGPGAFPGRPRGPGSRESTRPAESPPAGREPAP